MFNADTHILCEMNVIHRLREMYQFNFTFHHAFIGGWFAILLISFNMFLQNNVSAEAAENDVKSLYNFDDKVVRR